MIPHPVIARPPGITTPGAARPVFTNRPPRELFGSDPSAALGLYLTGADQDGGHQADPHASIGAWRSSTIAAGLGWRVAPAAAIDGVEILDVGGANGTGTAILAALDADALAWTPPDGAAGDATAIAPGQVAAVYGDSDRGKYVLVRRTTAADLAGSMPVELLDQMNNLFLNAGDAGGTDYRCLAFYNQSAGSIGDVNIALGLLGTVVDTPVGGYAAGAVTITVSDGFADWPASGFVENDATGEVMYYASRTDDALTVAAAGRDVHDETVGGAGVGVAGTAGDDLSPIPGLRIGLEAPRTRMNGFSIGRPPIGITWAHPTSLSDANRLTVAALAQGAVYGLWMERKLLAAPTAAEAADLRLQYSFESDL